MLSDLAESYYSQEQDLNCAEAVVYAADEWYQLKLTRETLRSIGGFGGGMAIEATCGALSGAIAVLGILLVEERAHESDRLRESVSRLLQRYEKEMGTVNCRELKDRYREEDPVKCRVVVREAARILEEILTEEGICPVPGSIVCNQD